MGKMLLPLLVWLFVANGARAASKSIVRDTTLPSWKEFRSLKHPEILNRFGRDAYSRELIEKHYKINRKQRTRALVATGVLVAASALLGISVEGASGMATAVFIAIGAPVIVGLLIFIGVALLRLASYRKKKLYTRLQKHFSATGR